MSLKGVLDQLAIDVRGGHLCRTDRQGSVTGAGNAGSDGEFRHDRCPRDALRRCRPCRTASWSITCTAMSAVPPAGRLKRPPKRPSLAASPVNSRAARCDGR